MTTVLQDGLGLLRARGPGVHHRRVRQAPLQRVDVQRDDHPLDLDQADEPGYEPGQDNDGDEGDPACEEDTPAPPAGRSGSR
jgi:hypothetical protein